MIFASDVSPEFTLFLLLILDNEGNEGSENDDKL